MANGIQGSELGILLITGTEGNDRLIGGSGNEYIQGLGGNDYLDGNGSIEPQIGGDTLAGGTGNDRYRVHGTQDIVIEYANEGEDTVDSLVSYVLGEHLEHLILSNSESGPADLNGTGNALDNTIIGNYGNNILDGGAGNDTLFGWEGSDTLIGGLGDDTFYVDDASDQVIEFADEGHDLVVSSFSYVLGDNLEDLALGDGDINGTGNGFDNLIYGGDGNNILDGGTGDDTLMGWLGDDTYLVDSTGDSVVEEAEEGNDTVRASVSYALADNIENLVLTGSTNIDGTGNALDNTITGNEGSNVLDGASGNDTLTGGLGDDSYIVDAEGDVVIEAADEGSDTVRTAVSYTIGANVENLVLTGSADTNGTGNTLDNAITGNNANNVLSALEGNDTLNGGAGIDTLMGGLGDDLYLVDSDTDTLVEGEGEGLDTVRSSVSLSLAANIENLVLIGSSNLNGTGNELDNTITGNSGNNLLDGGSGANTLIGGLGNDIYVIDSATDILVEAANEGIDTVKSSVTYTLAANLENLGLSGSLHIDGTGNAADNTLSGNNGNNILTGLAGDDILDGDDGTDTATYGGAMSGYRLSINAAGQLVVTDIDNSDGNMGADTLSGIELLQFSDGALTLSAYSGSQVNTYTAGNQGYSSVAALSNGGYVVTWESAGQDGSGSGIYSQRYSADGSKAGSEVRVNTYTSGDQKYSSVAALPDGGYIVTWTSSQDGSGFGIYAQRYHTNGFKAGGEFRVNTHTTGDQLYSAITTQTNGSFVIAWEGEGTSGIGVYAQRYAANGTKIGGELHVNTTSLGQLTDLNSISIATLQNNGFVATWLGVNDNYAQRYDVNGVKVGGEIRVGDGTIPNSRDPSVAALTNGGFVIAWQGGSSDTDVYAQRYDASGVQIGTKFRVNTDATGGQYDPSITALADGGFLITWDSDAQDTSTSGIRAQKYNADGTKVGGELYFSTWVQNEITLPSVAATSDGGFVMTWTSSGEDGSGLGIHIERYDSQGRITHIEGDSGNNTLNFSGAAITLAGGRGNDMYVVDNAAAILLEQDSSGTDTVKSSITWTLSTNFENLTLAGSANINGTGNAANNIITGNSGNNTLNGNGGTDSLLGGAGNDSYVIDTATDTLTENASAGTDLVHSSVTYTLGANIENLTLTGSSAINGTGNTLVNILTGNGADNVLSGSSGNDTLTGGAGDDHLIGGTGNDSLTGAAGIDRFRFDTALNGSTNVDTITSFVVADDTIQLQNAIFAKLTATGTLAAGNFRASTAGTAADTTDYILYETDTGKLFYDADGSGAGARVQFALVGSSTHPTLTAADFQVI